MQTGDWALIISILSLIVSLAAFVWNVWSKFIYPKPVVSVTFSMVQVVELGSDETPEVLTLRATNMGPSEVTLTHVMIDLRERFSPDKGFGLLSTLDNYPLHQDVTRGHFGAGLPAPVPVGGQYTAYLVPDHERLAKGDYQRIGFSDTFGRHHWAPRRNILEALPYIRAACERAGKNWRNARS
ncbi:hypothetical protein RAD15_25430 [Bradyrhizobium sp. 14AA]